jgi:hypothetical protein
MLPPSSPQGAFGTGLCRGRISDLPPQRRGPVPSPPRRGPVAGDPESPGTPGPTARARFDAECSAIVRTKGPWLKPSYGRLVFRGRMPLLPPCRSDMRSNAPFVKPSRGLRNGFVPGMHLRSSTPATRTCLWDPESPGAPGPTARARFAAECSAIVRTNGPWLKPSYGRLAFRGMNAPAPSVLLCRVSIRGSRTPPPDPWSLFSVPVPCQSQRK